jgi:hypothetical protein
MTKHFIALSGYHGHLPDRMAVFSKRIDAVDHLIGMFKFPVNGSRADDLRKSGYTELGRDFDADYAKVEECNCGHPEIHGDD